MIDRQNETMRDQRAAERKDRADRVEALREILMTPKQRMDRDIDAAPGLGLSAGSCKAVKAFYEQQYAETKAPATVPDAPLLTASKSLAAYESRFMAGGGGQNYERDQLVVLKRIEQAVTETARKDPPNVSGLN